MEEFEEAPEEFDLGISSYSIAHPIEENIETTPVNDVNDYFDFKPYIDLSGINKCASPQYRATPTPTDQVSRMSPNLKNIANSSNTCISSTSQEPFFIPSTQFSLPFVHSQFPDFNPTDPMMSDSMHSLFDQFPTVPLLFDSSFLSNPFTSSPFTSMPVQGNKENQASKHQESERVIPIQVINSPYQQKPKNKVNNNYFLENTLNLFVSLGFPFETS